MTTSENDLEIRPILVELLGKWRNLFLTGGLFGLVALAVTYLMTPTYRAEAMIVPSSWSQRELGDTGLHPDLAELAGLWRPSGDSHFVAIATLKSRVMTEAFLNDENLLPVLFSDKWDSSEKKWNVADPKQIPSLSLGYKIFDERVRTIEEDRRTGILTLRIEWHDPEIAAKWANELVRRTNKKLREDSIGEGQQTIAYVERELEHASSVEIRQALFRIIEVQLKLIAVASTKEEFAFKVIDPAVPPIQRYKPKRFMVTAFAFLVGCAFAALFVISGIRTNSRST